MLLYQFVTVDVTKWLPIHREKRHKPKPVVLWDHSGPAHLMRLTNSMPFQMLPPASVPISNKTASGVVCTMGLNRLTNLVGISHNS